MRHRERRDLRATYKAATATMDGAESDVSGLALVAIGGLTLWWWAAGIPNRPSA